MRIRRRSRPWLPLWGSWRANSEPERAFAVPNLRIGAVIERIPGGNHGAFFIFATACALSVTAFSRASSPIGRAKGRASPPSAPPNSHPRTQKPAHDHHGSCPGFVLLFVEGCDMLVNGTTSIPVSGSPDFFGGDRFLFAPFTLKGGDSYGYMERVISVLHCNCNCYCPGEPGE